MASMTRQIAMPRARNMGVNMNSHNIQIMHWQHLSFFVLELVHELRYLLAHFLGNSYAVNLSMNAMFASMSQSGSKMMKSRVKIVFPQNENGS